jgi:hypothetical protein
MNTIALQEPTTDLQTNNKGRPELYTTLVKPRYDDIYEWLAEGNTEESVAKKLGVHPYTWIRYKQDNCELSELITRARQSAGQLMLHKQYQKGSGMIVPLKKQKLTKDGEIIDIIEEQFIPPDTNAADFWGRHMMPDYKAPKEPGNLTLIQNNYQLPELKQQLLQIEQELKKLESPVAVDVEVIERD